MNVMAIQQGGVEEYDLVEHLKAAHAKSTFRSSARVKSQPFASSAGFQKIAGRSSKHSPPLILSKPCTMISSRSKRRRQLTTYSALMWVVALQCLLDFSSCVAADQNPASVDLVKNQQRNVLLICVDDLRPELKCFGADYIQSPHIDALAKVGTRFRRHYVQAPTCGASRYALLTGRYGPSSNGALFSRAAKINKDPSKVAPSMPAWLKQHGYTTVSVGKVSHHPGGLGGANWDDAAEPEMPLSWDRHLMPCGPWRHPRGAMHGLANGEIRTDPSKMDVFQSEVGDDEIYPDGLILGQAKTELKQLASDHAKPFFLAVGFIRPHLPFGAPAKYMQPYQDMTLPTIGAPGKPSGTTTWHRSGEFMRYNRWGKNPNEDSNFAIKCRQHYAACVSYADEMVGQLMAELKATGQAENTIVILWGDHGWHLGEHSIWGKHALFEESLHSPLIICSPKSSHPGQAIDHIVETLDVFPTVCELCEVPVAAKLQGESLVGLLNGQEESRSKQSAISYGKAKTIRTDRYRFIQHAKGEVELYDHQSNPTETVNIADQSPDVVAALQGLLKQRLKDRD